VSGRGFALLRKAGVVVRTGVMADEARALNAGFLSRLLHGRPHLTLKLASTLDGRIATSAGESRWITGPQARTHAHLMRARADAVLIGAGTARADDPMLDVRGFGPSAAQPVRIVADGGLSLPLTGRLVSTARRLPLWVLHREGADHDRCAALDSAGVRLIAVPTAADGRLDMAAALDRLAAEGLTRVLCEGGGQIAAALIAADRVDEIAAFTAGAILGGDGRDSVAGFGLDRLADAPRFERAGTACVGPDILTRWRRIADRSETSSEDPCSQASSGK